MAWGQNRDEAIARMKRALKECVIIGIPTTIPFHQEILKDQRFVIGDVHTGLVTDWMAEQMNEAVSPEPQITGVRANGKVPG
jgi:acetyl-CoA carboxylase biotin carboxylase subunit